MLYRCLEKDAVVCRVSETLQVFVMLVFCYLTICSRLMTAAKGMDVDLPAGGLFLQGNVSAL